MDTCELTSPPGSDHALEDVLAHVRVDGGEGVVEQVHVAVAVHGTASNYGRS